MRVLLVEDNDANREMLSRRLERAGHVVLAAADGAQGVRVARESVPDVVLMDMSLPVMDGWEATRQLKADQATRHIPVVALTAHAMFEDRERALEAGCDMFLTKPIQFPELIETLAAIAALPPR